MSKRFSTMDELQEFVGTLQKWAEVEINNSGGLQPVAALIITKDIQTGSNFKGQDFMVAMVTAEQFNNKTDKRAFAGTIRQAAERGDAPCVSFMSEAWSVVLDKAKVEDMESVMELARNGELHTHQQRKEVVSLSVEHELFGSKMYQAEIIRESGKTCLSKFIELSTSPEAKSEGLFTGFVKSAKPKAMA